MFYECPKCDQVMVVYYPQFKYAYCLNAECDYEKDAGKDSELERQILKELHIMEEIESTKEPPIETRQ